MEDLLQMIYDQKTIIKCLVLLCFTFLLWTTGSSMNYNAIISNSCTMPVLDYPNMYESSTHSIYSSFSEVNYPWFTDIIYIEQLNRTFSIGDFLIYSGLIMLLSCVVLLIKEFISVLRRKDG